MPEPQIKTFTINETADLFTGWLKIFVKEHPFVEQQIDDVKEYWGIGHVIPQPRYGNKWRVEVYTSNIYSWAYDPGGGELLYPAHMQPVAIEATIEEFTGRLLIDLTCNDDRLNNLFIEMLQAIGERWPEAFPDDSQSSTGISNEIIAIYGDDPELISDIERHELAKKYGNVRASTIRNWQALTPLIKAGLTEEKIAELRGSPLTTIKSQIKNMKDKGWYDDYINLYQS